MSGLCSDEMSVSSTSPTPPTVADLMESKGGVDISHIMETLQDFYKTMPDTKKFLFLLAAPTGSGKSTFYNAFKNFIGSDVATVNSGIYHSQKTGIANITKEHYKKEMSKADKKNHKLKVRDSVLDSAIKANASVIYDTRMNKPDVVIHDIEKMRKAEYGIILISPQVSSDEAIERIRKRDGTPVAQGGKGKIFGDQEEMEARVEHAVFSDNYASVAMRCDMALRLSSQLCADGVVMRVSDQITKQAPSVEVAEASSQQRLSKCINTVNPQNYF